ncbi:MAG: type II toxin-antitoxin system HicB family antitoxin [Planctomycetota bacterium]|nr:type II toxin-antitoxin system HicB family antitoxin [Planctomycetota bacterium]
MLRKFKIIIEHEQEGGYSVYVPALPGCHTQGDTIEEAMTNVKEAVECYIESIRKDGLSLPELTEEIVDEVEVIV